MAYIRDADEEPDDYRLDFSELFCPNDRCGCNDVEVLTYPRPGKRWFGSGRARCNFCGAEFAVWLEEDKPDEPTVDLICPNCKFIGEADNTLGNRMARCPECNTTFEYRARRT